MAWVVRTFPVGNCAIGSGSIWIFPKRYVQLCVCFTLIHATNGSCLCVVPLLLKDRYFKYLLFEHVCLSWASMCYCPALKWSCKYWSVDLHLWRLLLVTSDWSVWSLPMVSWSGEAYIIYLSEWKKVMLFFCTLRKGIILLYWPFGSSLPPVYSC